MKKINFFTILTILTVGMLALVAQAEVLTDEGVLGPIARNADNSIKQMSQYDAEKYCKDQGQRLPAAKELALALNPKGVRETPTEGFYEIVSKDQPSFYYSYKAYVRPSGDEGQEWIWIWTSSVHPYYSTFAYGFSGYYGFLGNYGRDYYNYAVRCVSQR